MKAKVAKPTRQELQRQIKELEAQLVHRLAFTAKELDKFNRDKFMGSGVIITIEGLGGRIKLNPVMIRDGLSHATIDALKADLLYSYEVATINKP